MLQKIKGYHLMAGSLRLRASTHRWVGTLRKEAGSRTPPSLRGSIHLAALLEQTIYLGDDLRSGLT
jgi:hypothetical protein